MGSLIVLLSGLAIIAAFFLIRNFRNHEVEDFLSLQDSAFVDPKSRQCLVRLYALKKGGLDEHTLTRVKRKLRVRKFRYATEDEIDFLHFKDPRFGQYRYFLCRKSDGTIGMCYKFLETDNPLETPVIALVKVSTDS